MHQDQQRTKIALGCCIYGDALIVTNCGTKPAKLIMAGDEVSTYTGEFSKVLAVKSRKLNRIEKLYCIKDDTDFEPRYIYITGNHKVLTRDGWIKVKILNKISPIKYFKDGVLLDHNVSVSVANRGITEYAIKIKCLCQLPHV